MFHVHVQGPLFSPFPALHSHKLLYNKPINILLVIILDLEMFYQQLMNYISPKILSQDVFLMSLSYGIPVIYGIIRMLYACGW